MRCLQYSELIFPLEMPREVFGDWSMIGVPTRHALRVRCDDLAWVAMIQRAMRDDVWFDSPISARKRHVWVPRAMCDGLCFDNFPCARRDVLGMIFCA